MQHLHVSAQVATKQRALEDALWHLGVRHIDMPLTPERVWPAFVVAGVQSALTQLNNPAKVALLRFGVSEFGNFVDPHHEVTDDGVEDPQPDAFTDLRPADARHLALELLAAAEDAEAIERAGSVCTGSAA